MSETERNLIIDITEDDNEKNLFRAEMMNYYKNKSEEVLLNEKYRLEIKMYEKENYDPAYLTDVFSKILTLFISIVALVFSFESLNLQLKKDISSDMKSNISLIIFLLVMSIITAIFVVIDIKAKDKNQRICKQCKIALKCIDDILNERQFQTTACNSEVKKYYIEVKNRK